MRRYGFSLALHEPQVPVGAGASLDLGPAAFTPRRARVRRPPRTHAARGRRARTSGRAATTAREASRSALLRVLTPQARSRLGNLDGPGLGAGRRLRCPAMRKSARGHQGSPAPLVPTYEERIRRSRSHRRIQVPLHACARQSHLLARAPAQRCARSNQRSASRSPTCVARSHLLRTLPLASRALPRAVPLALRAPTCVAPAECVGGAQAVGAVRSARA